MYLDGAEQALRPEAAGQKVHDLGNRWHGAAKVEARGSVERVAPGRRDERDHQSVTRRHVDDDRRGGILILTVGQAKMYSLGAQLTVADRANP